MQPKRNGRNRVIIESVYPQVDGGEFPIKRVVGEIVDVEADIFADGHDSICCALLFAEEGREWSEVAMRPLGNDRWVGRFRVEKIGKYKYTVIAWVNHFLTWHKDMHKRIRANQDLKVDVDIGICHIKDAIDNASASVPARLVEILKQIESAKSVDEKVSLIMRQEMLDLVDSARNRSHTTKYPLELSVVVDPVHARCGAWYEFFPRSCSPIPDEHATLKDAAKRIPYVASMGFDIIYLPPIHPIGDTARKGKNNAPNCEKGDVGSPWAIGNKSGGHKAIHPDLGTMEDFSHFLEIAQRYDIKVAMDVAFQCSPDHPYVKEHDAWFKHRPDGTIQYAENPPKKYQDIYPIDFETADWEALWEELGSIFQFWIDHGVKIFRVDNPHTKAFPFWQWVIGDIKSRHPDVIFLSEAFTRPKVMYRLAKLGFSQSYTYFSWRNTKHEIVEYMTELGSHGLRDYFRPNFWPNTPDILPEFLQYGGRPAFIIRFVLAATLSSNYGIYGPAFELCEARAKDVGGEEYWYSEKYQVKNWDLESSESLREIISQVNSIRKENVALHSNQRLRFHDIDNPQLLCYSKSSEDQTNVVIMVVNLDPYHKQSGWLDLPIESFGMNVDQSYQMHDLITDARYHWHGHRNFIALDPHVMPVHVFLLRRKLRTEEDFDYFI